MDEPLSAMICKTYDPKCWDLAAAFLDELGPLKQPACIDALARRIQATIEEFLEDIAP